MKSSNVRTYLALRFISGCIDMWIAWFWLSRDMYIIMVLALFLAIRDLTPITAEVISLLTDTLKN